MKRLLPLVLLACLCICLGVGCGSSHAGKAGSDVVLRAVPQNGEAVTPAGMALVRNILVNRAGHLSVESPTVAIRNGDEIVLSGSFPASLPCVIGTPGQLQFFDFEKDLAAPTVKNGNPTPYPTLYSLLSVPLVARSEVGRPYYLFESRPPHRVLGGPTGTIEDLLAPYGGEQPARSLIYTVPANHEVVSGTAMDFTAATKPVGRSPDGRYWYLFRLPPEITGADLKKSAIQAMHDPYTNQPQVAIGFTPHGGKEFQAITKAEFDRGRLVAGLHGSAGQFNPVHAQHDAIVLDGKLVSTPFIDYTDNALSLGIAAGNGAIIGNMGSMAEAKRLALILQSGSLPYRFEEVSSKLCRR